MPCSLQCMSYLSWHVVRIDSVKPFFTKGNQWSLEKGLCWGETGQYLFKGSQVCFLDVQQMQDGYIVPYFRQFDSYLQRKTWFFIFIGQTVRRVQEHQLIMLVLIREAHQQNLVAYDDGVKQCTLNSLVAYAFLKRPSAGMRRYCRTHLAVMRQKEMKLHVRPLPLNLFATTY